MFKDVTQKSLITEHGRSFGAAWGDFNQDGWVDLWVTNHGRSPHIYQNRGNGTFVDVTTDFLPTKPQGDHHAAAWADFDNDGDLDLIQLVGGDSGRDSLTDPNSANLFFINQGNTFQEQAIDFGLDYIASRGRTPLWYDQNRDGLLDVFLGAQNRSDGLVPATVFQQQRQGKGFQNLQADLNFDLSSATHATLSDILPNNIGPELIVSKAKEKVAIYDSSTLIEITDFILEQDYSTEDFISEDFNGDLQPDLFITRRGLSNSGFSSSGNKAVNFNLQVAETTQGITLHTKGKIKLHLWTFGFSFGQIKSENIFIGVLGLNPADLDLTLGESNNLTTEVTLPLDPTNPKVRGIVDFASGQDEGIYIGYDPSNNQWQIAVSSSDRDLVAGTIESSKKITTTEATNFNNDLEALDDLLLINQDGKLRDSTTDSGLNTVRTAGVSTVAGDFDNDMDLDLYVVTANSAGNEPNVLYKNQGNGTFVAADNLGDGFGTDLGIGESVTTSDYNNDGFLDLFITNGNFPNFLSRDAPYQLLENQGNEHHWLMIDLEGSASNRDAIGSKVYLTAGGITQLRQQSGGIHNRTQNDTRLHFGLADHTLVDEIVIHWASGEIQTLENISADQILNIIEPKTI